MVLPCLAPSRKAGRAGPADANLAEPTPPREPPHLKAEPRLQHAERRDEDSRRLLLAQRAPAPALTQGPILDRPIAAEDVPDAGAGRGRDAADRLKRTPDAPVRIRLIDI